MNGVTAEISHTRARARAPDTDHRREERVLECVCPTVRNHSHQCPGCPLVSLLLGFMVPCLGWMQTRPLVILHSIMAMTPVLPLFKIYIYPRFDELFDPHTDPR